MEKLIGSLASKTQWFALLVAVLGALQDNMAVITEIVGADNIGKVMYVIAGAIAVLRWFTTKSLDEKLS